MYRVDTRPHNSGRNRPNYSYKKHRKILKKGKAFRRLLEARSKYDEETNTITYLHATRGYRRRFLTPQLSSQLLGGRS